MSRLKRFKQYKVLANKKCYICNCECVALFEIKKHSDDKDIIISNGHIFYKLNDNWYRKPLKTLDHIIPLSKGGSDRFENLAPCCYQCNTEKGDKTLDEYKRYRNGNLQK